MYIPIDPKRKRTKNETTNIALVHEIIGVKNFSVAIHFSAIFDFDLNNLVLLLCAHNKSINIQFSIR